MSTSGSISGFFQKSKSSVHNRFVPSTLSSAEIKPVALGYRDLAEQAVKRQPGLSPLEKNLTREKSYEAIAGEKQGADMRTRSYGAQKGLQGAAVLDQLGRNDQAAMQAQRDAAVQSILAEHTIRESDLVRQASIAAGFLWPAEQARAAGQILSSNTKGTAWGVEAGYGAKAT